jgi:hypothetical protein
MFSVLELIIFLQGKKAMENEKTNIQEEKTKMMERKEGPASRF